MFYVNEALSILMEEFSFSFVKASGSGGQKVNKTNSQVQLRWNIYSSKCLSAKQRELLEVNLRSKLTNDGDLIVISDAARSQHMNKEDCLSKFAKLLDQALYVAKPRKKNQTNQSF